MLKYMKEQNAKMEMKREESRAREAKISSIEKQIKAIDTKNTQLQYNIVENFQKHSKGEIKEIEFKKSKRKRKLNGQN